MSAKLLTTAEFAAAIGMKEATIRQWVWLRKIEYVKLGKSVRFKPETVEKMIVRGTVPVRGGDGERR